MRIAALRRLGLHKNVFGLTPSARLCSATFFCARETANAVSFIGRKKPSVTAGTLGEKIIGKNYFCFCFVPCPVGLLALCGTLRPS